MANQNESESPSRPPLQHNEYSNESHTNGTADFAVHPKVVKFRRESYEPGRSSTDQMNEQSPLLHPRFSRDEDALKVISPLDEDEWTSEGRAETKSTWYLFLLTLGGLGLQIAWSVEMSNGSPYLLSLGISKSVLALVWIAGPLSGVLVQPYVGIKSDRCRSKWGKRRPFIIGGGLATIVSLMILAWTREIVGGFLGIFGVDKQSRGAAIAVMCFAVLFIYVLDFAINVIQAGLRAFIVDCAPMHQQESANAWISRASGIGNILGMLSGYVYLPNLFPFLGDSQFKVLCAIASFCLFITAGISCAAIKERDPRLEGEPLDVEEGVVAFFKGLSRSIRKLPTQIGRVCQVQLAAWIGWFPFLFYISTYIGEIYVEPFFEENPHMSEEEIEKTWERGTRTGSFALLIFAITTFISSVFLPYIVAPTYQPPAPTAATPLTPTTPGSLSASGYFNYIPPDKISKSKWKRFMALSNHLVIESLTLRRAWLLSHLLFAACMWLTIFVRNVTLATILVGLVGIPWALTNWAPFALISSEISKRDAIRRGLLRPPPTTDGQLLAEGEDDTADQAGVVLGIHNVSISAPQVIATLVSSLIFKVLAKPRGTPGDNSVAWALRFGGLCALLAAYLTMRVGEDKEDIDTD